MSGDSGPGGSLRAVILTSSSAPGAAALTTGERLVGIGRFFGAYCFWAELGAFLAGLVTGVSPRHGTVQFYRLWEWNGIAPARDVVPSVCPRRRAPDG